MVAFTSLLGSHSGEGAQEGQPFQGDVHRGQEVEDILWHRYISQPALIKSVHLFCIQVQANEITSLNSVLSYVSGEREQRGESE